jgi:hypothetical protein
MFKMKKLYSEEVKALLAAIDDLIDIRLLIRKIVPNYNLNEATYKSFLSKLESLQEKLKPIFSKYLSTEGMSLIEPSQDVKNELLNLVKSNTIILISANSSKKKLKNIGINPRNLIVSGGPLFVEDYKVINPNLSEKALENIKKKCDRLINQLQNEDWRKRNILFIYEKENPTDELILNKIDRISNLIGKSLKTIELKSWNDLEN